MERKTGLQQHHVKIRKYGICMVYVRFFPFNTSDFPFHTWVIPCIPYRFFPSIPYHSMPCLGYACKPVTSSL